MEKINECGAANVSRQCRALMIMSPIIKTSEGGWNGENKHEMEGSDERAGAGAGGSRRADGWPVERLWQRYRSAGAAGLVHCGAGVALMASNGAKPEKLRGKVLRLTRKKYNGEPDRRWQPGTWAAKRASRLEPGRYGGGCWRQCALNSCANALSTLAPRGCGAGGGKVRAPRSRRTGKKHFGELVRMVGSFHDWLEDRGPRGCLMNPVDDAPGNHPVPDGRTGKRSGRQSGW